MNHLIIFALVLNLVAGTAVFLYVWGAWRKYDRPFFVTLLFYILSFNGLNLADFAYQYARTNVVINDPSLARESPLLSGFLLLLVFGAEFAMAVTIYRLVERLKGRIPAGRSTLLLVTWALCFGVVSTYGFFILFRDGQGMFFYVVHAAWIFSVILVILASLVSGIVYSASSGKDQN